MKSVYYILLIVLAVFCCACKNETKSKKNNKDLKGNYTQLNYAKGFEIKDLGTYKVLEIKKPWPNAKQTYKHLLANYGDNRQADNTISLPIKRIVVTSTTHIPALDLLGVAHTLVGFPGTDYISSTSIRQRIDGGFVRELGKNESLNTEVLLQLNPDIVIGFGVEGVNKTFETLEKGGIPVIYNGDWVESSPLAKAEWLKFFGVLFNKEKEADSIFKNIERNYLEAKAIAAKATSKPSVFSGAMYSDVWYMPNGASPEAQFLIDANANYLWQDTSGNGSLALSFETVLAKANAADLWLSPSYFETFQQLEAANPLYANFKAFKTKNIYSFAGTKGSTGGVLYYELGTSRPDLVLKDIIKVCHPGLLEDYRSHFFKRLE